MKMMNDIAIDNIMKVMQNEIASGHAVIGIISVDEAGHIHLCWRTDDTKVSAQWETALREGFKGGMDHDLVTLPKES